jgi:serine/threonine protein kinase
MTVESRFSERELISETIVGAEQTITDTPSASIYTDTSRVGRYQLIYRIGAGGMATIYVGRLSGLAGFERLVAVKIIHQHLAKSKKFVNMFLDEARVAASIHHPNIAEIYEVGKDGEIFFMVGEFVHGQDLGKLLRRSDEIGHLLPPGLLSQIGAQICFGLHAAHETRDKDGNLLNLIHRDISPNNILISYSGFVKIIDFGVAWATGRLAHTETGALKGKVGYVAPEQITGQPLDRRSDIFSAGVMQYIMATMTHPFPGNSDAERLQKIVTGNVVPPREINPDVDPELERIILKAMSTSPDARYNTAAEMGQELEAYAESTGEDIKPESLSSVVTQLFESEELEHRTRLSLYRGTMRDSDEDLDVRMDVQTISRETLNDVLVNAAVKKATWRNMWILSALALMVLALAVAVFFLYKEKADKVKDGTPSDMTSETEPKTRKKNDGPTEVHSPGKTENLPPDEQAVRAIKTTEGTQAEKEPSPTEDTDKAPVKGADARKKRPGIFKKKEPALIQNPYQPD